MEDTVGPDVAAVDVDGMRAVLAETPVVFAILFGSRARGAASRSSDIDIALRFPTTIDGYERFRLRNRIDAELQAYAGGFVDVSDIDSLPTPIAHAALRDGVVLVEEGERLDTYRERIANEYEKEAPKRKRERREFIEHLAEGDT